MWENFLAPLILIFSLFPIFWLALTSFKNMAMSTPPRSSFRSLSITTGKSSASRTFFQYAGAQQPDRRQRCLAIAIPLGLAAAYVFARYHFKAGQALLIAVLVTQFIPPLVTVLPFWTLFKSLGISTSRIALIVVYLSIVMPYAIWMLVGYIDALPIEVEEAASVDGCTELQTLRHITLPLVMPGVITTLIFSFIMCWNEFTFALILTDQHSRTLQIALYSTNGYRGVLWEQMAAAGMLIMVPVFILSFLIRRYFVEGITMGAVK